MKRSKILGVFLLMGAVALTLAANSAFANGRGDGHHHHRHHSHWSSSFVIGFPLHYGHYYRYNPYWDYPRYPRTIVIERERRVDAGSGPPPQQYWYFCESADAYYPYVENCAEGWREVPASPPETR